MRCAGQCGLCGGDDWRAPDGFVPFTIHGAAFEEAGATAVEEVGLRAGGRGGFSGGVQERGVDADRAAAALDSALRWAPILLPDCQAACVPHAVGARGRELWRNALRSAGTHCGAHFAVEQDGLRSAREHFARNHRGDGRGAGRRGRGDGAPFDACYKQPDEASRRLARNTQLLLKHEAWMGRVADAGGGSYFIERLPTFWRARAGRSCRRSRRAADYRKAQAEGMIARRWSRSMAAREKAVASRRRVLVGTNQFANPAERALGRLRARE
jgi:methylmalonyl-CoA mutase